MDEKRKIEADLEQLSKMSKQIFLMVAWQNAIIICLTFISAIVVCFVVSFPNPFTVSAGAVCIGFTFWLAAKFNRRFLQKLDQRSRFCEEIEQRISAAGYSVSDFM